MSFFLISMITECKLLRHDISDVSFSFIILKKVQPSEDLMPLDKRHLVKRHLMCSLGLYVWRSVTYDYPKL